MSTVEKRQSATFEWFNEAPPDPDGFNPEYWLRNCEGFRVEFPGGARGYVEEMRYRDDPDRARLLAVRVGRLGRRVVLVPSDAVAFIVPRAERIWLKSPLEIARTEAAPRRRSHR